MVLFKDSNGVDITENDIINALEKIEAHKAKHLYIHTDISFGLLNPEMRRSDLLKILLDTILLLNVDNIIFPTYTFSFPNNQDYNVNSSKTLMGALNEFARKDARGVRSIDPIMSNLHFGKDRSLVTDIGKFSCGENSTFHKLSNLDNVKFLFFGADPLLCFTYSHFIEERLKVPYRYNQKFIGNITDRSGKIFIDEYDFFVRCRDVKAKCNPIIAEKSLNNGSQKRAICGNGYIATYDKDGISNLYIDCIKSDISFMLEKPVPKSFIKEFIADTYPVLAM